MRWALLFVPLTIFLGYLSAAVAGPMAGSAWFDALEKPSLFPPPATFRIAWTILYAMMGFALALVVAARGAPWRTAAIVAFAIQLVLNLFWSPLFFAKHQITGAFALILALDLVVIATIVLFWRVRPLAGALLLPYLAWILFASVLNFQFMMLNPDLDGQSVSGPVQRIEF
ncbi:MAG: TspO/MBR family protein [Sphingomonadaceae bacterium]